MNYLQDGHHCSITKLNNFAGQGTDLGMALFPQLFAHDPVVVGNSASQGFSGRLVDQNTCVVPKPNVEPVPCISYLFSSHHNGVHDIPLLHFVPARTGVRTQRLGFLDNTNNTVSHAGVGFRMLLQHFDTLGQLATSVVYHFQHRF